MTNVVKHFKWEPQGKRRLHTKPNSREIGACLPWLDAEINLIKPLVLVALGSTAAQGLFGRGILVTRDRGRLLPSSRAPFAMATIHLSAILRVETDEQHHQAMDLFVADLEVAAAALHKG